MQRTDCFLFVLLEHTRDGVDTVGIFPTRGGAEAARERIVKQKSRGATFYQRRKAEVVRHDGDTVAYWYTIHQSLAYGVGVHRKAKPPKRGKTTGRFATREELIERVENLYWRNNMSQEAIGKSCGVSQSTVGHLLADEIKKRRLGI